MYFDILFTIKGGVANIIDNIYARYAIIPT